MTEAVFVEAPSRLHFGPIDLRGDLGRWFGGIGAALEAPSLLLEASRAESLAAEGEDAERVLATARLFLEHHAIGAGARLRIHRGLPAHAGLGSGTQLALATGRALAALFGLAGDAPGLAAATSRGRRSAIGTWAFERGGFLLEGGRSTRGDAPAPLLLQRALPEAWRCVVAIPDVPRGLSGRAEDAAFRALPAPPPELGERIAHRVLMLVLPALVEQDLAGFGRGLTEVQRLVGEAFEPVQGARFAHPRVAALVDALLASGAAGAGQSSWGPAVFGLFGEEPQARGAAERLRAVEPHGLWLQVTGFNNRGARVWTATAPSGPSRG